MSLVFKSFYKKGKVSIQKKDELNQSALMVASKYNYLDIVKYLIEQVLLENADDDLSKTSLSINIVKSFNC